jgi:PAS domain S-box-containing protein
MLASAATTLGRGERPTISRVSHVAEVRELACALDDAAAAVREANAQLEERVRVRTAELSLSEARYRQLIDRSVQGIAIYRADRVALANEAALRMLGYASADELADLRAPDDFIAPEYRDEVRQRLEARLRGDPVPSVVQLEALRKDGTRVWVESAARVLEWEGLRSTLIVFMDISERRRRELAEQHATALERVAHLANATAHEINNPLTVIAGHVRMLRLKLLDDSDVVSRLERCQAAVTRITGMIANMQKISRLEMLDATGGVPTLDLRRSAQQDPE